jgi:hypothetical protein
MRDCCVIWTSIPVNSFKNSLHDLLPQKMIPVFIALSGIDVTNPAIRSAGGAA